MRLSAFYHKSPTIISFTLLAQLYAATSIGSSRAEIAPSMIGRDTSPVPAFTERPPAVSYPQHGTIAPDISPRRSRRHRAPSGLSSLSDRNLPATILIAGFQLLWQHMDIAVGTYVEHYRASEWYQELFKKVHSGEWGFGPTSQNILIGYGVFKLLLTVPGVGQELPAEFLETFAQYMLDIVAKTLVVGFRIVIFSANVVVWITMQIAQEGYDRDLIPRRLGSDRA